MPLRVSYCTVLMTLHVLRSSQLKPSLSFMFCLVWGPSLLHPAECSVPYDAVGQQGRSKH